MTGLIIVAVDQWTGSREALRWAAREAELRDARLHAVMTWRAPRPPAAPAARPPAVSTLSVADPQTEAETRLTTVLEEALGRDHQAMTSAVRGAPLPVLVNAAAEADLLVLDPPHLTDVSRARASLLAPQLIARVHCPVVIIPPRHPRPSSRLDLSA